jgi:hypothetical protein
MALIKVKGLELGISSLLVFLARARHASPLRKPSSLTDYLRLDYLHFWRAPILLETAHWNGLHIAPQRKEIIEMF